MQSVPNPCNAPERLNEKTPNVNVPSVGCTLFRNRIRLYACHVACHSYLMLLSYSTAPTTPHRSILPHPFPAESYLKPEGYALCLPILCKYASLPPLWFTTPYRFRYPAYPSLQVSVLPFCLAAVMWHNPHNNVKTYGTFLNSGSFPTPSPPLPGQLTLNSKNRYLPETLRYQLSISK
jgi:hypothetical protein